MDGSLLDLANADAGLKKNKHHHPGALLPQIFITLVVNFTAVGNGLFAGFPAVCLPQIRQDAAIGATVEDGSWIASLTALGSIFGCMTSTFVSDYLGRKKTMIAGGIPQIIGSFLIAAASNLDCIFAGRFLYGFGTGMQLGVRVVYVCEVTEPRIRGLATSSVVLSWAVGMLIMYALGITMFWRTASYIAAGVTVVSSLCLFALAESPTWMASTGRAAEAEVLLRKYRGSKCDIENELMALLKRVEEANEHAKITTRERLEEILSVSALRPFAILVALFVTCHFCGATVIFTYTVDLFQAMESNVNVYVATLIIGAVQVALNIFTVLLIAKVSKRYVFLCSGIGVGISLFVLGTYMYLDALYLSPGYDGLPARWVPAAATWSTLIFAVPGLVTVPYVLIGEMFPLRVRGVYSSVVGLVGYVLYFLTIKTYPALSIALHKYGVFWIYGSVAVTGSLFGFFAMPETKGKTLDEIEGKSNDLKCKT